VFKGVNTHALIVRDLQYADDADLLAAEETELQFTADRPSAR